MTKSAADRQKLRRDRLKAEGFTQRVVWVHKVDEERFNAFKETLVKPDTGQRDGSTVSDSSD